MARLANIFPLELANETGIAERGTVVKVSQSGTCGSKFANLGWKNAYSGPRRRKSVYRAPARPAQPLRMVRRHTAERDDRHGAALGEQAENRRAERPGTGMRSSTKNRRKHHCICTHTVRLADFQKIVGGGDGDLSPAPWGQCARGAVITVRIPFARGLRAV